MLKKSASGTLDICEAYLVKRRSFQDSDVSRFTNDEDGLFEHPAAALTSSSMVMSRRHIVRKSRFSADC
jgi:hypothetical protein